jgi:hypothetical protein
MGENVCIRGEQIRSQLEQIMLQTPVDRAAIGALFWQLVPLLEKQLQSPNGNRLYFPVIIDAVNDDYHGLAYPVPAENEQLKQLNQALLRSCWQAGGTFRGANQIESFQGYYVDTSKPLDKIIAEHLPTVFPPAKHLNIKAYPLKLGILKPRYTLKELADGFEMSAQELKFLTFKDKRLKMLSYKEGLLRYFKPQAVLYLASRDEKILERQIELMEMGAQLPGHIPAARWERMRALLKDRRTSITAEEVIRLFGSWKNFMAESGHPEPQRKIPADLSKQAMESYAKQFAKIYGIPPKIDLWLADPEFPHPKYVKPHWRTFAEFSAEFGAKPAETAARTQVNEDALKALALRGWNARHIADSLKITKETAVMHLERLGVLSPAWIKKRVKTIDDLLVQEIPNARPYQKQHARDWMESFIVSELSNEPSISYLGLEGPHFGSYISISKLAQISPEKSLIAEWAVREYLQMRSIATTCKPINRGEIFRGLNIEFGALSEVLEKQHNKKRNYQFNLANLDYYGPLNQEKITTLARLFDYQMLADRSLVFLTLNTSQMMNARLLKGNNTLGKKHMNGFPVNNQEVLTDYYVNEFSKNSGYKVSKLGSKKYQSRQTPMLVLGYLVEKV